MILGIINGWEEGNFKAVADKKLDAVEFCVNHNYDSAEVLSKAQDIKAYSEKYNVKVGSIGRWGMDRILADGEIDEEAFAHDKNLVDLASIVGCPVYNVGINDIEERSFYENCQSAIKYLSALIDYARDKGVKICVYNCRWCNFVCEDKAWSVVLGALPELGIKYDPSHCVDDGGDYLWELSKWGSRIGHFHVKGIIMIGDDHFDDPPAGLDMINWRAVMGMLYAADYNGMLSIEPHSRVWHGAKGQWGIDFTRDFIRSMMMPESCEYEQVDPYMP